MKRRRTEEEKGRWKDEWKAGARKKKNETIWPNKVWSGG